MALIATQKAESSSVVLQIGRNDIERPSPVVAFVLSALVTLVVFVVIWRIRKTFGMKE
jgi:hypothetical protein